MSKIDDDSNHNSVHLEHAQANPKAEDVPAGHHGMPDILTQQVMVSHLDEAKRSTRLRNRVDLRVTFILAVLYIWQGIDKGNIGNANIAGMNTDLKLYIGNRYSVVTMVFFIGYILIPIPAAYLSRRVGPEIWIPAICLFWGIITIVEGFTYSYGGLIPCRVLLGWLEGSLAPSAIFVISVWYKRYEAQLRFAGFYVIGVASAGFSGLLAYGIENMDGDQGIAGWRWIFILEGIATCATALVAAVFLVGLPEKASRRNWLGIPAFLNEGDRAIVLARIERDRGDSTSEEVTFMSMLRTGNDWKPYEFGLYVALNNLGIYTFSLFLPVILQHGFKYSTAQAQLYTFPPYAVSIPYMMFVAWFCDKLKIRGPVMIFNSCLYIIGISLIGFATDVHVRYGGVFLGILGITGNIPTNFAYQHNNTVGQNKRALCAAFMNMGGGIGGITASNVFRAQDAPGYRPGLIICIIAQVIAIMLVTKNFYIFSRANKKADRGEILIEDQPGFRYTY